MALKQPTGLKGVSGIAMSDVRRRGGGIRPTSSAASSAGTEHCFDTGHWDGVPYPGGACFFVEVPVEILEGAGGQFYADEVREILERHVALGVYPVIHTYGIDPAITEVEPGDGSVTVTWSHSDPGVSYKVFHSASRSGPWVAANTVPIAENPSGNSLTITNLGNGTIRYFFVVGGKDLTGTWVGLCGQVLPVGPVGVETECHLERTAAVPGLPRPSNQFSQEITVI